MVVTAKKTMKVVCKRCGKENEKEKKEYSCECKHCGYTTYYFVRRR